MKQIIGGIIVILGVLLVGCKTSRIGEQETLSGGRSAKRVFADCLKNSPDYTTYSAKTSIVLTTSTGNLKSKATIRIIKDEVLQISVQPFLGIEIFRIQLTNDSVWALDKMGRRYLAESIASYRSELPIDLTLSTIQALFLGRPFLPGKKSLEASDYQEFSWKENASGWTFSVKELSPLLCLFDVDDMARLTQTSVTNGTGQKQVNWKYSKFINQNGFWIPSEIEIGTKGILQKNLSLRIENITPEWNRTIDPSFSISSQYRKVSVRDLLNMIPK